MINNITLNIREVTNNGVPCENPVILVIGTTGEISFPCTEKVDKNGNLKISLPDNVFTNKCVKFAVQCSNCDSCGEEERTVCLCDDSNDCSQCSDCVGGICIDKCKPGEVCNGSTCCECNSETPCPQGFFCDGCKCQCAGIVNSKGECVQCQENSDCSDCEFCSNSQCVERTCPNNLICIGGDCGCPPGTQYDLVTNSCIPADECGKDGDCPECFTCVSGLCTEVICPENYKCVGGTCIFWPCSDKPCVDGSTCSDSCGCLNGVCTPCYLLECTGECAQALGCKCNTNTDKCEPVDNCGEYCDGNTPCLNSNCTCYNNVCISCENFPCVDGDGGCNSYYNCGCNDDGTCGGGKACNDKVELKKVEDCGTNECALEAIYTTASNCACDPIEFRVKNVKTCSLSNPRPSAVIMTLQTELFKNNRPYKDYLNELTIGDDELVSAAINTDITFYKKNANGRWELETVLAAPVPQVTVLGNAVDAITINTANVGFPGVDGTLQLNRKVKIVLRAVNVQVPSNDCIGYGDKVIAEYEIDFSDAGLACNKIEGYKVEQKTLVTDNASKRRPLFVWSKSSTGTFSAGKYVADKNYSTSGWFRKEYGEKEAGKNVWKDKVSKVIDGLWNNFNYKVTVDCGCKSNTASLEKVVFCCPKDFVYTTSNCGRKITVAKFNTCEVNKVLAASLNAPVQSQTNYWLTLNGTKEYNLRAEGGNLLNDWSVELAEPINTILFEQRYAGTNPLIAKGCEVTYTETPDLPDFGVEVECGKVVVKKLAGTPNITAVSFVDASFTKTFTPTSSNTVWTAADLPKITETLKISVTYSGGCMLVKEVTMTCQPEITATPTSIIAKGDCPGGVNPDIVVQVVSGFTSAAEFQDPRDLSWNPSQIVAGKVQRTFLNFAAGTYIFKVRETGKADATATVVIKPVLVPTVTSANICGTTLGGITLTNVKDTVWKVTGPAYPGNGSNFNSINEGRVSIPINLIGTYFVELVSSTEGATCQQTIQVEIKNEGGTITPTVQTSVSSICQGGDIQFKIEDGGENLTYLVSASGGQIQDINTSLPLGEVTASANGPYNAKIKVLSSGAVQINITAIKNNNGCYTLIPVTKTVTGIAGPIIAETDANCSGVQTYDAYAIITGTATSVTVNGFPATQVGNTWWAYGLTYNNSTNPEATVIATNGTCTTQSSFLVPTCTEENFCPQPPQTVQIAANPESPTCGQQNVDIDFQYSSLGDLTGSTYAWYEVLSGNNDTLASTSFANPGTISGAIPTLQVSSNTPGRYYRLKITTQGVCEFVSNTVEVISGASLNPTISGTTSGVLTTGSYNYFTATVPDATYEWTLTNINGTNQPIGTNSANVTISNFAAGSNTITVTVTTPNCTGTASLIVSTTLNCNKSIGIQPTVGSGSNGCKNLSGLVTSNPNGSSITSSRWLINDVETLVTVGSIANLDMSTIDPGDVVDVRLEVTFADGCVIAAPVYEYTRCGCICDATSICTEIVTSMADLTQAIAATEDMYILFPITDNPHRLVVTKGMTTLVDTLQFINNATFLPFDEGSFVYRSPLLVSVAPGGNIGALNVLNYTDCTLGSSNPDINPTVGVGVTAIRSTAATAIYIKVPAAVHLGNDIAINIIAGIDDTPCDPLLSAAPPTITVSCNPIAGAGTI